LLIRVVTSCTGKKVANASNPLVMSDFELSKEQFKMRELGLSSHKTTAGKMYSGRQHQFLMQAVEKLRAEGSGLEIEVWILSAAYGVINENEEIAPYDVTFTDMSKKVLRQWAIRRSIPDQMAALVQRPADFQMILLGSKYLDAAALGEDLTYEAPTMIVCGHSETPRLPQWPNVRLLGVGISEASRLRQGLVWIKGYIAAQVLSLIEGDNDLVSELVNSDFDLISELPGKPTQLQLEL